MTYGEMLLGGALAVVYLWCTLSAVIRADKDGVIMVAPFPTERDRQPKMFSAIRLMFVILGVLGFAVIMGKIALS